jgi:hypothetical protein
VAPAASTPDIAVVSATTSDSRGVAVTYRIAGASLAGAISIAIYRSADNRFDPASDVKLGEGTVSGTELDPGSHTITVGLPGGLPIDPAHPYVLAVADPGGVVAKSDETNNVGSFRTFVIGAVAHGLELTPGTPAWIGVMAASLRREGYDAAIPFDWSTFSSLPFPGATALAGQRLAAAVAATAQQLQLQPQFHPGDVIDLHLIGHSRGAVVISQAALDLEAIEQAGALSPLRAGWLKLTFLDPHPAHNVPSAGDPAGRTFSASNGPVGRLFQAGYRLFSAAAQDPAVVVPGNVDDAEVYYQQTDHRGTTSPDESPVANLAEKFFVPWGEVPVLGGPARYYNLTGIVHGHYEVHDWYQSNVVPTLGSAQQFVGPGSTTSPTSMPSGGDNPERSAAGAAAFEARVLTPAVFTRRDIASSFVQQLGATEEAFARGRLEEAIGRGTYLIRFLQVQARRGHIAPGVLEFIVGQLLPALGGLQAALPGLLTVRSRA